MTVTARDWSEGDQRAIREQLDRILASSAFAQSRRRQGFLKYIVDETLAGRGERLKGYSIALEVFDRPKSFDPNVDPAVRIEAGRLRDKLREYYEADGRSDPIRIDLPKGSYTPHIEFRPAPTGEPGPEQSVQAPAAPITALPSSAHTWSKLRVRWQITVSASALILVLGAGGLWLSRGLRLPAPQGAAEETALDAPRGPAIAVLPFLNLSGDPKQEYFSDGLTEDILTELSRARDLRVLARNTTFQYKGQAADVMKLGRELKVRYVLEGSIQRAADRLRITAQLIDTETGTHIWAERYDREMADVFLVQDEIVSQIVAKVAGGYGAIESTEAKSAARKGPGEIPAYDLVLRAHDVMQYDWTRANFRSARGSLHQAILLDPANARAHRELAWLAVLGWVFRFDETPVPPREIIEQATKAVQLDPADARARLVAALAYFFNKQLDLFEHEARQAMALAPYDAEIQATIGFMVGVSGQWLRGVALVTKANALNSSAATGWYHATMYLNYYLSGDYDRALEVIRQDPGRQSSYLYIGYIPIYGQLGRKQDALEKWHKLLAEDPSWSAKSFESWWHLRNMREEDIAKMMDGFYKSGVLEADAKPGQQSNP